MSFEIVLPGTNEKENSVKDLIISILIDNWPLTLKKVYNQIKKKYSVSVTYQAVHKAITELKEKKIVEKNNREYKLNINWIKNIKDFSEKLEESYKKERSCFETGNFSFDTVWELWPFFIDALKRDIFNAGNKSVCWIGNILINSQIGTEKEHNFYQEFFKKHRFIMVSKSSSLIDKIWKHYWEKMGVKVKVGVKMPINPTIDSFVIGDYVIQIFHTERESEIVKNLRKKVKKVSDIDMAKINDIYFKKFGKIHVVATKNTELASQLRSKVESLFK